MILLAREKLQSIVAPLYRNPAATVILSRVMTLLDFLLKAYYLLLKLHALRERGVIVEQKDADEKRSDQQEWYVGASLEPIRRLF